MGRLEVQGVVSAETGEPLVQFRQLGEDGEVEAMWQTGVMESRAMAQQVVEAAANAVYDAALLAWAKEDFPTNPDAGPTLITMVRKYRADSWGLPDQPKDWRND